MKAATPIAAVRWRRFRLAETDASDHASAACYCRSKHIRIEAVVMAELKFRDIQRHIFGAHLVERADHAALKQRPESLDRIGMHRADDILVWRDGQPSRGEA
jgi:hypothetical protein